MMGLLLSDGLCGDEHGEAVPSVSSFKLLCKRFVRNLCKRSLITQQRASPSPIPLLYILQWRRSVGPVAWGMCRYCSESMYGALGVWPKDHASCCHCLFQYT